VRAAPLVPRANVAARKLVPVILSATKAEALGARMEVGGLRIVDRAIRQLARLRDAHVVVAMDGTVPIPRRLPRNVERREMEGDVASGLERLRAELGPTVRMVQADTVWLQPSRFDRGMRVVNAASHRLAARTVLRDAQRNTVGIVDRLLNQKISSRLNQLVLSRVRVSPALVTLVAGLVGLYGTLLVSVGTWQSVVTGFGILEGHVILDGCAGELARIRLRQTTPAAWLDTVVGDLVNVVMILAVGFGLWQHGGSYLDMKMALAAAAMTLFYVAVTYRELLRHREGDVMKLRWLFANGQALNNLGGAGSSSVKAVMLLGRRDVVVALGLGLAYFGQLWFVLVYMIIVAMVRAAGAFGQLLPSDRRFPPPV